MLVKLDVLFKFNFQSIIASLSQLKTNKTAAWTLTVDFSQIFQLFWKHLQKNIFNSLIFIVSLKFKIYFLDIDEVKSEKRNYSPWWMIILFSLHINGIALHCSESINDIEESNLVTEWKFSFCN